MDDRLIARARWYAGQLVGREDAEDVCGEALLGYAQALDAGRVIEKPWGFLRVLVRRRAADLLERRRVRRGLFPFKRAAMMQDDGSLVTDADNFSQPGVDVESELVAHSDGPPLRRLVHRVSTPAQRRSVNAWLRTDSPVDAARVAGGDASRIHDQVGRAIRAARRALGIEAPPVVLTFTRANRIDVSPEVVADILAAPLTRGTGNALARKHGLTPQKVHDIRKAHGLRLPKRKRQVVTNCEHVDRPHTAHGMCGACANKHRRQVA